ncbi:MAG: c-type cytochrome [bacterium JZ-2024 1]
MQCIPSKVLFIVPVVVLLMASDCGQKKNGNAVVEGSATGTNLEKMHLPGPASTLAGSGKQDYTQRGKALFQRNCAACHASDGRGIQGLGSNLTTSAFVRSRSDTELLEFIKQGRPANDPQNRTGIAMPPRGGNPSLTDEELREIVAFLRSISR